MREYFIGIIAVVALGGLMVSLSPTANFSKQLRLLCGLCSVGCIVFPILTFASEFDVQKDAFLGLFEYKETECLNYDEIYNDSIFDAANKNAEENLKNDIIKELDLKNESFDIQIVLGEESVEKYIDRVEVIIYPEGIEIDPHGIEKYIKSRLNCPVVIIYDF